MSCSGHFEKIKFLVKKGKSLFFCLFFFSVRFPLFFFVENCNNIKIRYATGTVTLSWRSTTYETLPFQKCLRWRHNDEKPAAGAAAFCVFSENFPENDPLFQNNPVKNFRIPPSKNKKSVLEGGYWQWNRLMLEFLPSVKFCDWIFIVLYSAITVIEWT